MLRSLDGQTLQRRAERLSIESQITTFASLMPNRTAHLIDEAGACFTNGQYIGCVLALTAGVEYGLRTILKKANSTSLNNLIKQALANGVLTERQASVLSALKEYRNNVTHSNVDYLAAGRSLQRQRVILTEQGIVAAEEWEEFMPESQDEKEIAADLSAEQTSRELLVQVREVMHDIFDDN